MSIKSQSEIKSSIQSELADNNAGLISAYDVRHNMEDIVDSINTIVSSGDFDAGTPFTGSNIRAKIKYYNPNNFSLVLKQIDCDILMNNQPFTKVHLDTNFIIPANATFLVPAKMEFEMSTLVKNSMDIIFNKPIKLNIKGQATLSKGIFTKTVPIAFETNQKINLGAALTNN